MEDANNRGASIRLHVPPTVAMNTARWRTRTTARAQAESQAAALRVPVPARRSLSLLTSSRSPQRGVILVLSALRLPRPW